MAICVDLTQAALESTGFEKEGKYVGMWGNIGTGAVIGFAAGGPIGVPGGVLLGFGRWLVGAAVGGALDDKLD